MAKKASKQRLEPEFLPIRDGEAAAEPAERKIYHEDTEGHRRIISTLNAGREDSFAGLHGSRTPITDSGEADGWPVHRTFFFVFAFNAAAWVAIIGAIYYAIS